MRHSAAGSPRGFSQLFFSLNCKGFTPKGTKCSIQTQGSRGAAWASARFPLLPGGLEEKVSPQLSDHTGISKRPGRKPVAVSRPWGGGGGLHHSLSPGLRPSASESGKLSLPTKVLWAVLEFAGGLFKPQNPQSSA